MKQRFVRAVVALALVLLGANAAGAQNVTTTGQIRGRLSDPNGQPVAGALVTGRNTQTGLQRTAISEANGNYTLRLLPPGTYQVSTQMLGFSNQQQADVRVTLGQSTTVNLQLAAQAVQLAALEVTGTRAPVNVTDATVVQSVSRQEIDKLPVLGRDFVDFINLSGLVSPDPGETTGGQFSIAGQRSSQTNLQIDGVDANNAFFGENRGGSRIPFVFSLESIQEFQIITNGYDVEFGNYAGGVVDVVTRGGTNNFRGSAYINYRGDALTSRGFRDSLKVSEYEVTQYAGSVSGPFKRDKAFYLVSLEGQRRREPQIPLQIADYGPGQRKESPAVTAEIQRFWAAMDAVYGVSNAAAGYDPFQTTNDAITVFGRLDWNLNSKHRLSVRHNFSTYENDREFDDSFDFAYGASRAERIESLSNSFVSELSSVLSSNTYNVLRFQFSTEGRPRVGHNIRPSLILRLSNGDFIGFGGTFVGFNNDMQERKVQLIDNFTHVIGNHTLKAGVNAMFVHNRNEFLPGVSGLCGRGTQGSGIFCFSDIASFEASRPSSYQFNVLEGAQPGALVPITEFDVNEAALYLQDEWRATPRLTVTLGLRHDRQAFGDAPGRVVDVERAFGFPTSIAPTDNNNFSPRLAIAYDIGGDGRGVLRAGAGHFFGRVPHVIAGNVLGSARPIFNLTCSGSAAEGAPNAPPSPRDFTNWSTSGADNPINCAGVGGFSGVPSYTIWGPDFEYPETFKANAGFERLFGGRTKLAVDLIYSRSSNLYTVRNLNLRAAQFQLAGEGNRNVYTPATLFTPGSANITGSRIYSTLGDVFVNYTDGRAEAMIVTAEANHRLGESTSLRGSYTFTRSHDNSSFSCCQSISGYANPNVGEFGPNEIGGFGADDRAWGPSDFARDHTFIFSAFTELPFGISFGAMWRLQSGRPYSPEISGDINGDGVSFNDRPFIFAPENLPIAQTGAAGDSIRNAYAQLLQDRPCIGDFVGQIVPRNTCRTPWYNQLDLRLTKAFQTVSSQRAEIQLDIFNALNGIGRLNCKEEDMRTAIRAGSELPGWCGWGRFTTVTGANRNIYTTGNFTSGVIQYVPQNRTFGNESVIGSNLQLQFQAQLAVRYYF